MTPAVRKALGEVWAIVERWRTNPLAEGGPQGHRKPLADRMSRCKVANRSGRNGLPEVEVIKKRALVRLASPSMFRVPMNEVLMVLTALNW